MKAFESKDLLDFHFLDEVEIKELDEELELE